MTIGRIVGSLGVALTALVTAGSANAVVFPIVPGGTYIVAPDTDYKYSQAVPLPSNTDTFNFSYQGGLAIAQAFSFTNPNPPVQVGNGFTAFTVSFLEGAVTQFTHTFAAGESNLTFTALFPDITTSAATLYHLVVTWVQPVGGVGTYATTLETGPAGIGIPGTPLPPAALLFVSALAGWGLLARRRKAVS